MKRLMVILACIASMTLFQEETQAQVQSAMPSSNGLPAPEAQVESSFSVQETPVWAGGSDVIAPLAPRGNNSASDQPVESTTNAGTAASFETK